MPRSIKTPPKHIKPSQHRFRQVSTRGGGKLGMTFIGEDCRCGYRQERPATPAECKKVKEDWARNLLRSKLMFKVWRKVQALMKTCQTEMKEATVYQRYPKDHLSIALAKLRKKFPEHIEHVRVDDDSHCGSDLFLIKKWYDDPRVGKGFWGTSVIYIAQCTNEAPIIFFMYPGHMTNLREALTRIHKQERRLNKGKNRWEV